MKIEQAIATFLNHRRTRRRSAPTIDQYRYQLEDLWLAWRTQQGALEDLAQITRDELVAYFAYLAHEHVNRRTGQVGLAAETINSGWRTLRAFWHFAGSRGWLTDEQLSYFKNDGMIPRPDLQVRAPPVASDALVVELLAACAGLEDPEERARNRAILLLTEAGLRVGDLAGLQDADIDLKERCARIVNSSGRAMLVFWGHDSTVALRFYLRVRQGERGGALFRSVYAHSEGQPLTPSGIRRLIRRMATLAGVELPPGVQLVNVRRRLSRLG